MISEINECVIGVCLLVFGMIGAGFSFALSNTDLESILIVQSILLSGVGLILHSIFRKPSVFVKERSSR